VGAGEAAPAETLPIQTEVAPAATEPLPRRRRRGRRWRRLVAAVLILVMLAALGAAAIVAVPRLNDDGGTGSKPSGITVPELQGQPLDVAERRLEDLGLDSTEVSDSLFGVLFPSEWDVCRTDPAAGEVVRPRSTVRLFVDRPDVC
jgi:beta-lactam-binding protein with PASTA domain